MKALRVGMASLLAGCLLSGCCGFGCNECPHSPVAYSSGNPYECGNGDFWGVGHYCERYGFLCNAESCTDDWY